MNVSCIKINIGLYELGTTMLGVLIIGLCVGAWILTVKFVNVFFSAAVAIAGVMISVYIINKLINHSIEVTTGYKIGTRP